MTDATLLTQDAPIRLLSAQGLVLDEPTPIHTQVQSWADASGAMVRFIASRGLPMVDVELRFKAGTTQDTTQPGLAALTLYTLDEGSAGLSASEYAERLESLGAIFEKDIRLEYSTLTLRSLSAKDVLDPAIALFIDLVARPDFPAAGLDRVKGQLLAHRAEKLKYPTTRAIAEAYRHLFAGHPYAVPEGSTQEGIGAVSVDDLRAFHGKAYSANNLEIALVGDLSRDEAEAIAQQICQALPQGWAAAELPPLPTAAPGRIHIEQPGASHLMTLALPMAVPATAPEYLRLILANEVLGSGLNSRLMKALRQQRGLTYDISSALRPLRVGGLLMVRWEAAAEYVDASLQLVRQTVQAFIEQGPSAAELQAAHRQLIGPMLRSVAQNRGLVALLGKMAYKQLPDDYLATYLPQLAALTPEQVRETLLSNLDINLSVEISVGPAAPQQPLPPGPADEQ